MILALIRRRCDTIGTINLDMSWDISLRSGTLAKNFFFLDVSKGGSPLYNFKDICSAHYVLFGKIVLLVRDSEVVTREMMDKKLQLQRQKLVLKIYKNIEM